MYKCLLNVITKDGSEHSVGDVINVTDADELKFLLSRRAIVAVPNPEPEKATKKGAAAPANEAESK